jgi:hypothetical protein
MYLYLPHVKKTYFRFQVNSETYRKKNNTIIKPNVWFLKLKKKCRKREMKSI